MSTFWAVMIGGAIATQGRIMLWIGELFLEEAAGVPIINSPDDLGRMEARQAEKQVGKEVSETVVRRTYNYGKYGDNFFSKSDEIRRDLGIPDDWVARASKKDEGVRFIDPNNPQNNIRVMPGRSDSEFLNSQSPYVIRYKDGAPVDKNGEKILNTTGTNQNKSSDLHVPIQEFNF